MSANVLLVVLDAVRAKNCGMYTSKNTTPFLNEFKNHSTVYTQARSAGCWSLPGHAGLFTGYIPEEHGVRQEGDKLEPGHTIWEELQDIGHRTGVFTYNGFLQTNRNGLTHGFEQTVTEYPRRPYSEALDPRDVDLSPANTYREYLSKSLRHEHPFKSIYNGLSWMMSDLDENKKSRYFVDQFLDWISGGNGEWGACLNLLDAHHEYLPHEDDLDKYDELLSLQEHDKSLAYEFYGGERSWSQLDKLEKLYDSAIRRLDSTLEYMIDQLREIGEYENTLIVITADHGEGFGEESRIDPGYRIVAHRGGIHEVLFHVPLVVKYPGQRVGKRVDALASLTQFPHVVHGVLNGNQESFSQDTVLVSAKTPRGNEERSFAHYYCDDTDWIYRYKRALYTENEDGAIGKYMTSESDVEDHSRAMGLTIRGDHFDEEELRSKFLDVWSSVEPKNLGVEADTELDEQTESRLRELGYIN